MPKRLILFLIGIIFLFSFSFAQAGIVINEIMYSSNSEDTDWVEIYNEGNSSVLITTMGSSDAWRISTSTSNSPTKFNLNGDDFNISPEEYVILAADKDVFLSKHSGYSGVVVDITASGFNNEEGNIQLWDNNFISISGLHYTSSMGANGDGNTLQKISGSWVGTLPTPGAVNEASASPSPVPETGSSSGSGGSSSSGASQAIPILQKIKTEIKTKTLVFAGVPVIFEGSVRGYSGEPLHSGKFFWNFGDGDSREMNLSFTPEKFTHTYFYPGEYLVSLEYRLNYYSEAPDASDKIILKVVSANLVISKVGDERDFFVEISNNTAYETDLSGWILKSGDKNFIFAKNTILGAKKEIRLSPQITNFSITDKPGLKLLDSQGISVFDYTASLASASIARVQTKAAATTISLANGDASEILEASWANGEEISKEVLTATPILSGYEEGQAGGLPFPIIIFSAFLSFSAGAVYFLRRMTDSRVPGDDFELLDE